ncbi:MAG: LAGLIDADG family homing endonuclease [Candidatus Omnitrophica bacterium]|nr:LAGLIDADG family homing endonuclease [Candidatus Omnitrophota bacterium]
MLSADYIVGLTDGEGCFYVHARARQSNSAQPRVDTHFYIKLHEEEKNLLELVRETFGCGGVYAQKEKRSNHSPCYRFEINSQRDVVEVLIPFFEKHPLQSQKQRNFKIFKEIALMVKRKEHKDPEGFKQILRLKSQMNLGARRMRQIRSSGGNAE